MTNRSALDAANNAFQKSNDPYIGYWIGRLKFGIDYMRAIDEFDRMREQLIPSAG